MKGHELRFRVTLLGGVVLFVSGGVVASFGQAGCSENFNDILIIHDAGLGDADGGAEAGGGGAGGAVGAAGRGGSGGLAGGGGNAGSSGNAGKAGGAGCSEGDTQCSQGNVLSCEGGTFVPKQSCVLGCAAGDCIQIVSAALGGEHSCTLLSDGTVRCWGDNANGQLGRGAGAGLAPSPKPAAVAGLAAVKQIALGSRHSCALDKMGAVWCWGKNERGQVGNGKAGSGQQEAAAVAVSLPTAASQIAVGDLHSCALTTQGVFCWGDNLWGQLGEGSLFSSTPIATKKLANVTRIAAGSSRTAAILADQSAVAWGKTISDGATAAQANPGPQSIGPVPSIEDIVLGDEHLCVKRSGDLVFCKGMNQLGQLGVPTAGVGTTALTQVDDLAPVSQLIAAGNHSCVLRGSSLRFWGDNSMLELGISTPPLVGMPTPLAAVKEELAAVASGSHHLCAITKQDSSLLCWGVNSKGQLGRGTLSPQETPAAVVF